MTARLSLVVIAYNMRRELPRTVLSLAPSHQSMPPDDYEIIVVDNGSTEPLTQRELNELAPNVTAVTVDNPSHSPSRAVNIGLESASGDVTGVFIDGARIASPGLLNGALACFAKTDAVVGTHGFHLGTQVQRLAIQQGYNAEEEDRLLSSIGWPTNGYRLFEISVFSGSSRRGWYKRPAETNSLFASRSSWAQLGGYDEKFQSRGGGIVNHDTWDRACALPGIKPFLLLGEGTFHQIHGGVSTNARESPWRQFTAEFKELRGRDYSFEDQPITLAGSIPSDSLGADLPYQPEPKRPEVT